MHEVFYSNNRKKMKRLSGFIVFVLAMLCGISVAQAQEPEKIVLTTGAAIDSEVILTLNNEATVTQGLQLVQVIQEESDELSTASYRVTQPEVILSGKLVWVEMHPSFKPTGASLVHVPNLTHFIYEPPKMEGVEYHSIMKEIKLENCPKLEVAAVIRLGMEKISVKNCPKLERFTCAYNKLTELEITGCDALYWIQMQCNLLTPESVSRLIQLLSDRTGKDAGHIFAISLHAEDRDQNKISSQNVKEGSGKNWLIKDTTNSPYPGYDYVPGVVSDDEIRLVTRLTVGQGDNYIPLGIETYPGEEFAIEGGVYDSTHGGKRYFKLLSQSLVIKGKVRAFNCSAAEITSIDVSGNPQLEELYIDDNDHLTNVVFGDISKLKVLRATDIPLGNVDLSKAVNLHTLLCQRSGVPMPDLRKLVNLRTLHCSGNNWSRMDLTHTPDLEVLGAAGCGLRSLDLSKNTRLKDVQLQSNFLAELAFNSEELFSIMIFDNEIKGEKMTALMNSLPIFELKPIDEGGADEAQIVVISTATSSTPEMNRCLDTDVAIATEKHWMVKSIDENYKLHLYEGIETTSVNAPDLTGLHIYPNSATEELIISELAAGSHLQLFRADGVLVRSFIVTSERVAMHIGGLPQGVYLLRVGGQTHKVLIE